MVCWHGRYACSPLLGGGSGGGEKRRSHALFLVVFVLLCFCCHVGCTFAVTKPKEEETSKPNGSAAGSLPERKGFLQKAGEVNKSFQTRYFILKDQQLHYQKAESDTVRFGLYVCGRVRVCLHAPLTHTHTLALTHTHTLSLSPSHTLSL